MLNKKVDASIIICVYNAEKTIKSTLDSIFTSEFSSKFEVIIVDDCSTDNTIDICKAFDINLIRLNQNRGPAVARNIGVANSNGPVIVFLDSDITFPPDLLEKILIQMSANNDSDGVGTISSPVPLNSGFCSRYFALQEYATVSKFLFDDAHVSDWPFICTRCGSIKRSVFNSLGGFNEAYKKPSIEDYELSTRMMGKYSISWVKNLVNNHHFPDSIGKIFKRYHRNTKEMYRLMKNTSGGTIGVFKNDALARLLLCFGLTLLGMGIFWPYFLPASVILIFLSAILQRHLLSLFYTHENLWFTIKGSILYAACSLPIASGLMCGMFENAKQRLGRDIKKGDIRI